MYIKMEDKTLFADRFISQKESEFLKKVGKKHQSNVGNSEVVISCLCYDQINITETRL